MSWAARVLLLFSARLVQAEIDSASSGAQLQVPVQWLHIPKTVRRGRAGSRAAREGRLLQRRSRARDLSLSLSRALSLAVAQGTSFVNTLFHAQCPRLPRAARCARADDDRSPELSFFRAYPPERWCEADALGRNRTADGVPEGLALWQGHHRGLGYADRSKPAAARERRAAVGFFRPPRERLLSGFLDGPHGFRNCVAKRACDAPDAAAYGRAYAGVATRMLLARWDIFDWQPSRQRVRLPRYALTARDVADAKARLAEAFQFVGLTPYWALSICLWHAKFGGACLPEVEFANVRARDRAASAALRDANASLDAAGWSDAHDAAVFDAAARIFWRDVERYGVTEEGCVAAGCWPKERVA